MQSLKLAAVLTLAGATMMTASVPAASAPLAVDTRLNAATSQGIEEVRWRGHHRRGHHHRWHRDRYSWGPAIGGLAAGAIIGSAIANSRAQASDEIAYCSRRFKSYDPASGTYLGYDGLRHPCP